MFTVKHNDPRPGKEQLHHKHILMLMMIMLFMISLVAQTVKRLPTMWETRVQSPGWEDPLEKEMAIHPNTLAW